MSYALVTGASKGIGKAIAYELAKRNYNVLLVARSEEQLKTACAELENTYKVKAAYLVADLTQPDSPAAILNWVEGKDVSILVNNAGYGLWGSFDELTLDQQLQMMQINMLCMVKLTHLLLPVLKKQQQSYLLNVASTAAYQAVARLNIYSASKTFVLQFSRALKRELKSTSVSVTCLSPGATETGFMDRAGMDSPKLQKNAGKFNMKVADVAAFAVDGMLKKKTEIIPGLVNKISVAMTYYIPKWITETIAQGLYEK